MAVAGVGPNDDEGTLKSMEVLVEGILEAGGPGTAPEATRKRLRKV